MSPTVSRGTTWCRRVARSSPTRGSKARPPRCAVHANLKDARNREGAEAIARKLVPIVFRIEARSGSEGRLFGSVTAGDIVDSVSRQSGIELDRRRLVIEEAIKTLGSHEVGVRLHPEVEFRLSLEVVSSN